MGQEIAKMLQLMSPEIEKIIQFLDPETSDMLESRCYESRIFILRKKANSIQQEPTGKRRNQGNK